MHVVPLLQTFCPGCSLLSHVLALPSTYANQKIEIKDEKRCEVTTFPEEYLVEKAGEILRLWSGLNWSLCNS